MSSRPAPAWSSRQRFADYRLRRRQLPPEESAAGPAPTPLEQAERERRRKRQRSFITLLGQFWGIIRPFRGRIVAGLITLAVSSALLLIMPAATKVAIDFIITDTPGPSGLPDWIPIPPAWRDGSAADRVNLLLMLGAGLMIVTTVRIAVDLWGRWQFTTLTKRIQAMLRRRVFDHSVRLPLHRVQSIRSGGVASMLREDAGGAGELLFHMIYNPAGAAIQLAGSLIILAATDWRLLAGSILLLPTVWITHKTWIARIRPLFRDIRATQTAIDAHAAEAFGGMRVVRGFAREATEAARFVRGNHLMARQEMLAWWWSRAVDIAWSLFIPLASAGVLVYGGWAVVNKQLTVGDVMMFLAYLMLLLGPLESLASSATSMQDNLARFDRVLDLLAEPREFQRPTSSNSTAPAASTILPASPATIPSTFGPPAAAATSAGSPAGDVVLDRRRVAGGLMLHDVTYTYPSRAGPAVGVNPLADPARSDAGPPRQAQPALRGVSLEIPAGATVALVGPSGSGKTTLCNLVARFDDPTSGRIQLDGIDLARCDVASYRRLLGIVEQDVFLFDGTVAENIAFARREAPMPDIVAAARAANADGFIRALEAGYDTLIGERGVRLSGGQKQRLAIARAILSDPRILILDEATSNLDSQSERSIQTSLVDLMKGRTCLVIAHRLSTVRHADLIVVLDQGRIIETGTHDQLMALGGRYASYLNLQIAPPQASPQAASPDHPGGLPAAPGTDQDAGELVDDLSM